ncbi:MAG: hypothetical protein QXF41_02675 [Candidatus Micrarchaeaceae archaeon]
MDSIAEMFWFQSDLAAFAITAYRACGTALRGYHCTATFRALDVAIFLKLE